MEFKKLFRDFFFSSKERERKQRKKLFRDIM